MTFRALDAGWTLTAADGPVPSALAAALAAGIPATVPGEAHLDLLAAGLIADPFDGDNEAAQQWIGDVSWRFSTTFSHQPSGADRVDLVARGLDTVATVELNGVEIARTQNMHRSYRWDVRPLLRAGDNVLTLTFAAPVPETERRAAARGALPRVNHHEYNQLRKMACSFGWDWGIDVAGAGIWQEIGLESWSSVRLAAVRPLVDVRAPQAGSAGLNSAGLDSADSDSVGADGILTCHVEIERATGQDAPGADGEVTVSATLTPPGQDGAVSATAVIPAGDTRATIEMRVADVQRWWPVGHGDEGRVKRQSAGTSEGKEAVDEQSEKHGEQPLYHLSVKAAADEWQGRIGFRTVEVDTTPDAHGAPFQLKINGRPIMVRGYNWIPDHAFLTRVTPQRYARGVADALDSGANLLRVWGGGIYEREDLYRLADEAGLLLWQDFPLACAAYPEDAETRVEIEAEAREHITRLSQHPSLVIWCGNNENTWGSVDWGWAGDPTVLRQGWGDYYYSELFPRLLAELDPTRFYTPASPYSFGRYRHPNDFRYGLSHSWEAWNRLPYQCYAEQSPRFMSEFGWQGPPALSTLTAVVRDEPLDPFGPQMLVHQKANLGNEKLRRGWQGHLPDPVGIADWHWTTQLNQAAAIRFGIEHFRSLAPLNSGVVVWQLNDNWPVISWAAVDHRGHRKPLWHAIKAAYAPRLATLQPRPSAQARARAWEGMPPERDLVSLVLLNDTAEPFAGDFRVTRETFDGRVLAAATLPVDLPAWGNATVDLPPEVFTFKDRAAEIVVARAAAPDSGYAQAIFNGAEVIEQALAPAAVTAVVQPTPTGLALTATASSYVRDLTVLADQVDPEARVDRGLVTLTAGQSVTFHIASRANLDPTFFISTLRSAGDLLGPVNK
ncbi:MAG: glycoside hydrolase family 2 protein [Promicromonosporaceae bacterium]|nr:glycoside hydrolase family 2 protein [Promicromonosporaceae bacterium]